MNALQQLYQAKSHNIHETRRRVLQRAKDMSPVLGKGVEQLINLPERAHSGSELLPWMLQDAFGVSSPVATDIATAWLGLYLYVGVIDDLIDRSREVRPAEILASSALFRDSIITLQRHVSGTSYERVLEQSLVKAADSELTESALSHMAAPRDDLSSGKNSHIIACVAAMAASARSRSNAGYEFSHPMMAWAQFLDDICDWKEDFRAHRVSSLTTRVMQKLQMNSRGVNPRGRSPKRDWIFLRDAVMTGALAELLEKSIELLDESTRAIRKNRGATDTAKYLSAYGKELRKLLRHVRRSAKNASQVSLTKEKVMGIERQIKKLAFHS